MLPEINDINGNICDIEKQFGVIFTRETAVKCIDNGNITLHLLPSEWIAANVAVNKTIIGLIASIVPTASKCGLAVVVFVNSGTTFTGFEIWDINSNVLDSGDISTSGNSYGGGPSPQALIKPTQHDVTVTYNQVQNTVRVQGTNDISLLWGLIELDTCVFDVTINLETMQPV